MAQTRAGSDIDAWCTKCQLDLAHVIIAVVGVRPVRVQCKTCGSIHGYKRGVDVRERAANPKTPKTKARGGQSSYDAMMQGRDVTRARRYRPAESFAAGDLISHPTFGVGVVAKVVDAGKVDVAFAAGNKILVHSRAS